ncbi:hypothetical protein DIPPA_16575 [Diplonema papillatum]|nr:hypothetical protein DIPPA_16575 [Diplonema papillatum]
MVKRGSVSAICDTDTESSDSSTCYEESSEPEGSEAIEEAEKVEKDVEGGGTTMAALVAELSPELVGPVSIVDSMAQWQNNRSEREFGQIPGAHFQLRNEQRGAECGYIALWRAVTWRSTGRMDLPSTSQLLTFARERFGTTSRSVAGLPQLDCWQVARCCQQEDLGFMLSPDCALTALFNSKTGMFANNEERDALRKENVVFLSGAGNGHNGHFCNMFLGDPPVPPAAKSTKPAPKKAAPKPARKPALNKKAPIKAVRTNLKRSDKVSPIAELPFDEEKTGLQPFGRVHPCRHILMFIHFCGYRQDHRPDDSIPQPESSGWVVSRTGGG